MKKILFLMSALALTVFAGCEKDAVLPENENENGKKMLTIYTTIEKEDTKVSFDDETLHVDWEMNDQLYALGYDASGKYVGKTVMTVTSIEPMDNGKRKAMFQGLVVNGAAKYEFHRVTPNVRITEDGKVAYEQIVQHQSDGQSCEIGKYLNIGTPYSFEMWQNNESIDWVQMYHKNTVMRFDILSYPEEVGEVKAVTWTSNVDSYRAHSYRVELDKSPAAGEPLKVWFAFDRRDMYMPANAKLSLELEGSKGKMIVTGVSAKGNMYDTGARYHITVSKEPMAQALCTWANPDDLNKLKTVKVKTVGNKRPADCEYFVLEDKIDAEGYWRYIQTDGEVVNIPSEMFMNRTDIVEIVFPETAKTVGSSAFENCTSLQKISGLQNVTEIYGRSFIGCPSLTFELPTQTVWIGGEAFIGCKISSTVIPIIENSSYTGLFKGCEFVNSEIRLAEGSKEVGPNMFYGCKGPENLSLYIPDSVTKIGQFAFGGSAFTKIDGMREVTTIEPFAFQAWKGKTFTLPAKLTYAGYSLLVDSSVEEVRVEFGTDCQLEESTFNGIGRTVPCKLILNEAWRDNPNGPILMGNIYQWTYGYFSSVEYVKM